MAEGGEQYTPVTEGSQPATQPDSPRLSLSQVAKEPLPPSDSLADSEEDREVRILTDKLTHVSPVRTPLHDTIAMVDKSPRVERPRHSTDLEGQIKLGELELQKLQMQLQLEQLKLQHELELHNSRLAHELALKKLDISMAEQSKCSNASVPAFCVDTAIKFIPKFTEDDVDTFLTSFERIAALHQWPKEQYAAILHAHLSGKALNVLNELSLDDCQDYDKLKSSILTAYAVVPEVHRKTFRALTKAAGETYSEFAFKVTTQFRKWTESEQAYSDVVALRELIQLEKFVSDLDHELRVWLIDQKPKTLHDAAKLADQYAAVRKGFMVQRDGASPRSSGTRATQTTLVGTEANQTTDTWSINQNSSSPARKSRLFFKDIKCFYCKKPGHTISVCKQRLANEERAAVQDSAPVQLVSLSGPEFMAVTVPDTEYKANETLSCLDLVPLGYRDHCHEGVLRRSNGTARPIRLLRDTGALQSLVSSRSLSSVEVEDTGENRQIRSVCGEVQSIPLVRVNLHCALCSGTFLCGLVGTLPPGIDILVGNDLVPPASCPVEVGVATCSQAAKLGVLDSEVGVGTTYDKLPNPTADLESVDAEENLNLDLESLLDDTCQGLEFDVSNTHRELCQLQQADVERKPLLGLVQDQSNAFISAPAYLLIDELLLRTPRDRDVPADSPIQVVVPRKLHGRSVVGPLILTKRQWLGDTDLSTAKKSLDYVIATPDRRKAHPVCQVNLLREYRERDPSQFFELTP